MRRFLDFFIDFCFFAIIFLNTLIDGYFLVLLMTIIDKIQPMDR